MFFTSLEFNRDVETLKSFGDREISIVFINSIHSYIHTYITVF